MNYEPIGKPTTFSPYLSDLELVEQLKKMKLIKPSAFYREALRYYIAAVVKQNEDIMQQIKEYKNEVTKQV